MRISPSMSHKDSLLLFLEPTGISLSSSSPIFSSKALHLAFKLGPHPQWDSTTGVESPELVFSRTTSWESKSPVAPTHYGLCFVNQCSPFFTKDFKSLMLRVCSYSFCLLILNIFVFLFTIWFTHLKCFGRWASKRGSSWSTGWDMEVGWSQEENYFEKSTPNLVRQRIL